MTKIHSFLSWIVLLALVALAGCQDPSEELNLTLAPANVLFTPADNLSVKLQPTTSASVVFEWEQAKSEEGTLVLYEVLFDKETGDFSNPVAVVLSDGSGAQNRLTLSHKNLNKIAATAGIASLASGKLKWTVTSSKGPNIVRSTNARTISVDRPAGFAEVPAAAYLTGSATEAGADIAKALPLKKTAEGTFEIFTSLKAGSFKIVSGTTGETKAYSATSNLSALAEGGETTIAGDTKVYRLEFDFNNAAMTATEITEVGLWISAQNKVTAVLPYVGNSTWKIENTPIEFFQFDWGRDERYKFRMKTKTNSEEGEIWYASQSKDNSRPVTGTPATYFNLISQPASQWDYTFKFASEVDNKNVDITMLFQPATEYTHKIVVR
jgi:hypothetical protein